MQHGWHRLVWASCACLAAALAAAEAPGAEGRPAAAGHSDWAQWRGPARNGIAPASPALAESWPEDGPPRLWQSEPLPSGGDGGYGSPVVADGRVYLYVHWRYRVPLATRKLSDGALRGLGWIPERLPAELEAALEETRGSEKRAALKGDDLRAWIDGWIDARLDEAQKKRFASFVRGRLARGKDAIPLPTLDKLAAIRDRELASQDELDRWLDGQGITGDARKEILSRIPTEDQKARDVVICLDAETGKTLWKVEQPTGGGSISSTLCVADGRCYGVLSTGEAICLDARDGREIWRAKCRGTHSSFLVEQGLAVILADGLTAFDAATGKVAWQQRKVRGGENSPVCWRSGAKTYLICNTSREAACVDLKSGDVIWTVEGGGPSTAAVADGHMAILTSREELGLVAYRLAEDKPVRLWNLTDLTDRGASPLIHAGHVYASSGRGVACVDLQTGKRVWESKPGNGDVCSPVLVDGKLLAVLGGGRTLGVLRATPERADLLAKCRLSGSACASPAVVGGRLFLRMKDGIACFDLTPSARAGQ